MILREGIEGFSIKRSAITTGNFDGVHLGHQFLLKKLVAEAKKRSLASVVVMFYPHPKEVLGSGIDDFRYLNSQNDKYELFESLGINSVVVVPFSLEMAKLSAHDFIQKILIEKLNMEFFLIGHDHRLGNPQYETNILKVASGLPLEVAECTPFKSSVGLVSSSKIRKSLQMNEVKNAAIMLGRNFKIKCTVVDGRKVGRSIGYPTANLRLIDEKCQIPAQGVYAVNVMHEGKNYGGMMMIGSRPTLNDGRGETMEVFIFDFNKDIYHQELEVSFVDFVRDNMRFENIEALKYQLEQDEINIRKILNK